MGGSQPVALGASSVFETQVHRTGEAGKWAMGEDFDLCNSCVVIFMAEWELFRKAEGCDQHFLPVCCHLSPKGVSACSVGLCSGICVVVCVTAYTYTQAVAEMCWLP